MRWHLQRNLTPIPKGSSKEHIVENYGAFDFELDPAEMRAIAKLNRDQYVFFDTDVLA